MSNIAIRAQGLSKSYRFGGRQRYKALRDTLTSALFAPYRYAAGAFRSPQPKARNGSDGLLWALRDVSFDINQGEAVGIIGPNGAGKSTLLKVLSRITEPTEGRAELHGSLGSLLEVGTGFHPELTGRENIYLNGAILGMKRSEIRQKFDAIVEFADMERFLDTAVKFYSSGMHVRLAFAVAAHLEPEILLVDEVLAVGDIEFQKKCLGKMNEIGRSGRTVLFVSHSMPAIQSLCTRGLVLSQGGVAFDGTVDEAVRFYLGGLSIDAERAFEDEQHRRGNGWVRLVGARVLGDCSQPSEHLVAGQPASFEFTYANPSGSSQANLTAIIYNQLGTAVAALSLGLTGQAARDLAPSGKFVCHMPKLPLPIGQYRVSVTVNLRNMVMDEVPNALVFEVASSTFFPTGRTPEPHRGACMIEHSWHHEALTAPGN